MREVARLGTNTNTSTECPPLPPQPLAADRDHKSRSGQEHDTTVPVQQLAPAATATTVVRGGTGTSVRYLRTAAHPTYRRQPDQSQVSTLGSI